MDAGKWGESYERYEKLALRAAWQLLYTADDVQDAVQEAAVAVWARRRKLADGEEFRRLFIGAVVNQCRKRRRRYAKRDEDYHRHAAPAETPEGTAIRDELRSRVKAAVADLPDEQAEAVVLCLVEELSYADAAGAMGISVPSLRNHLYRGRRTLREKLEDLLR
ncbi:MAG: RNA polymerase sigma factor [Planctomycetes bacterium]|nr:RNA polymerase sigma factor [Planctomycetota bacterium]